MRVRMDYPGDPTKLTPEVIVAHYKRTGLKPCNKASMNAMIREQFLQLKETHAFYLDLISRGVIKDDGGAKCLENSYQELEKYIKRLDAYSNA